ncbi:hypothetical protein FGO68_gene8152 [Halteria grandinella]|uniref:Uncharacterized protein n=1 Tax=Halteria grandinella TaxID=5974 RepID=A0A8J8T4K7_HALGN|nr:hypothetical protein FGO68_gene8152 [Halteria grandinella]
MSHSCKSDSQNSIFPASKIVESDLASKRSRDQALPQDKIPEQCNNIQGSLSPNQECGKKHIEQDNQRKQLGVYNQREILNNKGYIKCRAGFCEDLLIGQPVSGFGSSSLARKFYADELCLINWKPSEFKQQDGQASSSFQRQQFASCDDLLPFARRKSPTKVIQEVNQPQAAQILTVKPMNDSVTVNYIPDLEPSQSESEMEDVSNNAQHTQMSARRENLLNNCRGQMIFTELTQRSLIGASALNQANDEEAQRTEGNGAFNWQDCQKTVLVKFQGDKRNNQPSLLRNQGQMRFAACRSQANHQIYNVAEGNIQDNIISNVQNAKILQDSLHKQQGNSDFQINYQQCTDIESSLNIKSSQHKQIEASKNKQIKTAILNEISFRKTRNQPLKTANGSNCHQSQVLNCQPTFVRNLQQDPSELTREGFVHAIDLQCLAIKDSTTSYFNAKIETSLSISRARNPILAGVKFLTPCCVAGKSKLVPFQNKEPQYTSAANGEFHNSAYQSVGQNYEDQKKTMKVDIAKVLKREAFFYDDNHHQLYTKNSQGIFHPVQKIISHQKHVTNQNQKTPKQNKYEQDEIADNLSKDQCVNGDLGAGLQQSHAQEESIQINDEDFVEADQCKMPSVVYKPCYLKHIHNE